MRIPIGPLLNFEDGLNPRTGSALSARLSSISAMDFISNAHSLSFFLISRKHPDHEDDHDYGQQDDQTEDNIELPAMLFCGPNFRKTALFATVNASSPHGIHTTKLVFFYIFRTTLWTHTSILHDEQIIHQSYNSTLD